MAHLKQGRSPGLLIVHRMRHRTRQDYHEPFRLSILIPSAEHRTSTPEVLNP